MKALLSFVVLGLGLLSAAGPVISPYTLHEKRTRTPVGWTLKRRHDPSSAIPLRFALTQRNIEDIGKYLMEVSHPESEKYGKHWSAGDVLETFAPSDETIEAVRSWLLESGVESGRIRLTPNKGWLEVTSTVEEAERLLRTEYKLYSHASGKEHVACDAYHLPSHIVPHVDFVTPSVHFDAKLTRRDSAEPARSIGQPGVSGPKTTGTLAVPAPSVTGVSNCNEYITLDCLRALYGLEYTPSAAGSNSYGIVEYTPQAYLQTDLDMFFGNFSPSQVGTSPNMVSIDGGYAQTEYQGFDYNGESDLDLQYGMGLLGPSQNVTLYQVGDMVEGASFNNFLDALDASYCTYEGGDDPTEDATYPDPYGGYQGPEACGTTTPANVISTSYAYDEADLTPFYTARQCSEYAKLGLMGVTVLYSSGDYGVAGNGGVCLTSDGEQTSDGTIFNPTFPGTCPYITSVGATMIPPNGTIYEPETACEEVIYSGGGFSNYFAMPEYQQAAVDYYLTNYYPDYPSTIWNSTGISRAYPDISANGANYVVAIDGEFELVYGTSCSSPVSGAIFTMVNDARIAAGKSTIGFINPTIYSSTFAGVFNDITTGSNPGCGTNGYNATVGWDPVTGLGTPNLPNMLAAWLALP